jgi:hypothetical protein
MSDESSNASFQLEGELTFEPIDVQEENPSIDMQTLLAQMQSRKTQIQAQIDALRATISSASSTTSVPQKAPFKPKPPTIGGVEELSPTNFIAWTGGKPNLQWTALDPTDGGLSTPAQYRSTSVSAAVKSHASRQTCLTTKMTRKGDLKEFEPFYC